MTYRTRKLLAALFLMIWLPLYIYVAWTIMHSLDRPSFVVELGIYIGLGVAWALPFRKLFLGIARADPDADAEPQPSDAAKQDSKSS